MALFRSVARPRSPRQRWHMATCARKTRNKTHHARSGGATGGPWCVLFPVSRARTCGQRRYRRARMYRPAPARGGPPPPSNLAPGATFGAAAVPRGLTSGELTVPSKGCRPQKKIFLTLFCARSSRRHSRLVKKYFWSKSVIYGDSSRGASICAPEVAKIGEMPPPRNHQNRILSVGRAATEPTTTIAHGHVRERNAKQNAPRAIGRSNWRSVVRFVSRFSRARVRTASVPARPHVQTGPRQGGYPPFRALQLWRP